MGAIGGSSTVSDEAQTADTQPQVFVDLTGHRRRWLQMAGYAAAFVCLIFAVILVTSLMYGPISPQAIQ
jgi:hypothetical protein